MLIFFLASSRFQGRVMFHCLTISGLLVNSLHVGTMPMFLSSKHCVKKTPTWTSCSFDNHEMSKRGGISKLKYILIQVCLSLHIYSIISF